MAIREFTGKYRFLSNFWPCLIEMDGKIYPSVEHAYQAAKSMLDEEREGIRLAGTAAQAKRLGRQVRAMTVHWDEVRLGAMTALVHRKFEDPLLARDLLATGDQELIEGNYWNDTFWGQCRGVGKNHLGKILMETRARLRA